MDDTLVASGSWEEHVRHLKEVLGCLKNAGLTAKSSKCEFGKRKLSLLGHEIGDGGLSVPEARVEGIRKIEKPRTRKQLKSFLGVINFYRRYIPNFHKLSHCLTPSTSLSAPAGVVWTEQMEEAFHLLRDKLRVIVLLCVCQCVLIRNRCLWHGHWWCLVRGERWTTTCHGVLLQAVAGGREALLCPRARGAGSVQDHSSFCLLLVWTYI